MTPAASLAPSLALDRDLQLVRHALSGCSFATERLMRRLLKVIRREVVERLRCGLPRSVGDASDDVDDLTQDVCILLLERDGRELRRWDPSRGATLDGFVRLVARRRVQRRLSQGRSKSRAVEPWSPDQLEERHPAGRSTEHVLEDRDRLQSLQCRLWPRMGERDIELFEALYVQERTPSELCEGLGTSAEALRAWSYRFRKQARALA